jgi:predicted ATPase
MDRLFVISGCSGGGKSSVLRELGRRSHHIVEEPGRRIIAEERGRADAALPWADPAAFATRAVAMSLADLEKAEILPGPVFFDRGLVDAAAALEFATGVPISRTYATRRYNTRVFMTPPWPEIYVRDGDRRYGLDAAIAEYERLLKAFASLGHAVTILPKACVTQRADLILAA